MAEIDRESFGLSLLAALESRGMSQSAAVAAHPALDKAMLSRATRGEQMSAGNYTLLCKTFGLDPYAFLLERPRLTLKTIAQQTVTHVEKRETQKEKHV